MNAFTIVLNYLIQKNFIDILRIGLLSVACLFSFYVELGTLVGTCSLIQPFDI